MVNKWKQLSCGSLVAFFPDDNLCLRMILDGGYPTCSGDVVLVLHAKWNECVLVDHTGITTGGCSEELSDGWSGWWWDSRDLTKCFNTILSHSRGSFLQLNWFWEDIRTFPKSRNMHMTHACFPLIGEQCITWTWLLESPLKALRRGL